MVVFNWGMCFALSSLPRPCPYPRVREQELGKDKGKSVMLMVHHSRNSAQKQWDETLVLCLNGMGRLLRSHLGVLSCLAGFDQRWAALMGFVEHSVLVGSREVGCAAVNSFVTILSAHAGAPSLPGALWERALSGFEATVSRACAPGSAVPGKVRTLEYHCFLVAPTPPQSRRFFSRPR